MLLIIEIILTVAAWKKGWKAWALVPIGIPLIIGFIVGLTMDPSQSIDAAVAPLIVIELACVAVLAFMAYRRPGGPVAAKGVSHQTEHTLAPTVPADDVNEMAGIPGD